MLRSIATKKVMPAVLRGFTQQGVVCCVEHSELGFLLYRSVLVGVVGATSGVKGWVVFRRGQH